MKANPQQIGRVVVSTQGHDRGRRCLVVGIVDERYVLIADGDTRKLDHPKKKQLKHLRAEPGLAADALDAVHKRAQTIDSDIRKALEAMTPEPPLGRKQADRSTDKEENAFVQE
ncbi:MAG: KOW domain-containing RNA-binding protein [Eubacteriales bacterium]|nr:KOW domain-containing RNA-binding protein [Eubacteriales bacterium]